MREFHNPVDLIKNLISPPKQARIPVGVSGGVSTPEQDAASERRAKEEAGRKARTAAAVRGGRRKTLLTPAGSQSSEINSATSPRLGSA